MAFTFLKTVTGTVTNIYGTALSNYSFKVDLYIEQSIANNTTRLKAIPTISCSSGTGNSSTYYFSVLGSADYHRTYIKLGYGTASYSAPEIIHTIYHETNGTKTLTFTAKVENEHTEGSNSNLNNYAMKRASISVSVALPTIPRASEFSISGNKIGSAITVSMSRYVSTFTHKVYYKFGSINTLVGNGVATSVTFTPALNDAKQIPNSTYGSATIVVETYNGATLVGTKSKVFNLYVADSMYPSISSILYSDSDTMESKLFISNRSKATLTINGAAGSYGSTIKSYSISGYGLSATTASATTPVLPAGTHTFKCTVTDSRGRTATKTYSITAYDYIKPQISNVTAYRCDASGNPNNSGTYVRASFTANIQNTGNANVNAKTWGLDWRLPGGNWNVGYLGGALTSYSQNVTTSITSGWDITKSYEVRIVLYDYYSSDVNTVVAIPTGVCAFDIEDSGIGIGKYHERGNVDIAGKVYIEGALDVGDIIYTTKDAYCNAIRPNFIHQRNYGLPAELGQYIDMHNAGSTNDVDVRLTARGRQGLQVARGDDLSRYIEMGTGSDDRYFYNNTSGKYLAMKDNGRLMYDGYTVPHNWRQSFSPFLFSDTGNFSMVESWGEAVYLGDLVWIRGRVRGSRGGHSGSVYIGGLPVSCIAGYPALELAFFGGVTTALGTSGFDIRAYLEGNASHAIITYSNKDTGGWHNLQCSHIITGNIDISFSATYRWR